MNSFTVSGNVSITAGAGSDTFTLTGIVGNLVSITATGPDTVSVSGVTARNDVNINVGAGSQLTAFEGLVVAPDTIPVTGRLL